MTSCLLSGSLASRSAAYHALNLRKGKKTKGQKLFMTFWQLEVHSLPVQVRRTPKTPDKRPEIIALVEQLERMKIGLRSFSFAASTLLSKGENRRLISRTYIKMTVWRFESSLMAPPWQIQMSTFWAGQKLRKRSLLFLTRFSSTKPPRRRIHLAWCDIRSTVSSCWRISAVASDSFLLEGIWHYVMSVFVDRFCKSGSPLIFLSNQYRMHPAISLFSTRHFYGVICGMSSDLRQALLKEVASPAASTSLNLACSIWRDCLSCCAYFEAGHPAVTNISSQMTRGWGRLTKYTIMGAWSPNAENLESAI